MKKNVVKLNENALRQIVAKSVKKVLNEISSDLAYAAYDKADKSGRFQQANNFSDYGETKLKNELGTTKKIIGMNNQGIIYYNNYHDAVTLYRNGSIYINNNFRTTIANYVKIQMELKTDDKSTARIIAKWLKKYMNNSINNINPQLLDWHFWAAL